MLRLSIITTILEAEEKLLDSIRSIRPRQNLEHLITVAGDYERASRLVRDLGEKRPVLIPAPKCNITDGFNECITRATGDLIWVLNSGDREINIDPLIDALAADPTLDFAYGDIRYGESLLRARPAPITKLGCCLHGMSFCHGAVVVRRSFHDRYGLYPFYDVCMDEGLFIPAILKGARMASVNSPVAYIEPGGRSNSPARRIPDLYQIMARHLPPPFPALLAAKWYAASHLGAFRSKWAR
jgi:hypothetical protein